MTEQADGPAPVRNMIKVMHSGIAFRYTEDGKHRDESAPENRFAIAQTDLYALRRGCLILRVRPRGVGLSAEYWIYFIEGSERDYDGALWYRAELLTYFSVPRAHKVEP